MKTCLTANVSDICTSLRLGMFRPASECSEGVLVYLDVCLPFLKGNNFCDFPFASLTEKTLPNGVQPQKKEFAPNGVNSSFNELTPIEKRDKVKNSRVTSPESISIHFY